MDYLLHIMVLVAIYSILAVSLDLLVGQTGLLSLAQGAFFGIGAYAAALLSVHFGVPFLVGLLIAMVVGALASLPVSLPSLRLYEDYFVICTFGFQLIIFSLMNNWMELTRGPLGLSGISPPSLFWWSVQSRVSFLTLAALLALLAHFIIWRISFSPFGRVLRAIREDETLARSLGKNTLWFKVKAFAVGGAFAALGGCLYAHYITYIDPTSFTVMESILVLSMVIVGGAASKWGPPLGAAVLVILPEALRFVGLPESVAASVRQILYGALLALMMAVRPRGLVGRYGFER